MAAPHRAMSADGGELREIVRGQDGGNVAMRLGVMAELKMRLSSG